MNRPLLGQHFLSEPSAAKKIIDALNLENNDVVIEIGSGKGVLTDELKIRNYGLRIIGIEKDAGLAEFLKKSYIHDSSIEIIKGDALKILPSMTHDSSFMIHGYKLVGNIPYYITGRLLRILSELETKPRIAVLTIQSEVAERITAKPPRMNLLSSITQFWSEPDIIARLSSHNFSPAPKVESAVIRLAEKKSGLAQKKSGASIDPMWPACYCKFARLLFKQPRKTIFNNLRAALPTEGTVLKKILESHGLTGSERPGLMTMEAIIALGIEFRPAICREAPDK